MIAIINIREVRFNYREAVPFKSSAFAFQAFR